MQVDSHFGRNSGTHAKGEKQNYGDSWKFKFSRFFLKDGSSIALK